MKAVKGIRRFEAFTAVCNHMPGNERTIRVTGTVVFAAPGWSARLTRRGGSGGTLVLELAVTPPREASGLEAMPAGVEWEEPAVVEYDRVAFELTGSNDDAPGPLAVAHPERPDEPVTDAAG